MPELHLRYRPKTWDAVVGQDKAVAQVRRSLVKGWGGRMWWIVGRPGTGCTATALLIANAGPQGTSVISTPAHSFGETAMNNLFAPPPAGVTPYPARAYVLDRPEVLPADSLHVLSAFAERPDDVALIFTTTPEAEAKFLAETPEAQELRGKCEQVRLAQSGLARPFAEHCKRIAEAEGLGGKPIEAYIDLARKCRNNLRKMLDEVVVGRMKA
jgi:hypothetical protein